MEILKIDIDSTPFSKRVFYNLYMKSFNDLCIWKGKKIINLNNEGIEVSSDYNEFLDNIQVILDLGTVIYYTRNSGVITSIALVKEKSHDCFTEIQFLCGNQTTKDIKINGKSQGNYMLDFIFETYRHSIIIIRPATSELIPYYVKYRRPNFPYNDLGETKGYLIYGDLEILPKECFAVIFTSIRIINNLVKYLDYSSITDLYYGTSNVINLKQKLLSKLDSDKITISMNDNYYQQIKNFINNIEYYDIDNIIRVSNSFSSSSVSSGGKIYKKNIKQNKTMKQKKQRKNKKRKTYRS